MVGYSTEESSMRLQPSSLDHIGLKVTDMDKSLRFYCDALGMDVEHTSGPHPNGGRSATVRAGEQRLDLFYRPDFVSADRDKPVGMDHLCLTFDLSAVEPLLEHLKAHAVEVMWGPVTRGRSTSVYVFDPDGIHVELRVPVVMEGAERPGEPAAARRP
ncbi:MAG: VOC family protein [Chloroflexi bacterium]|nr:VOC family protein [Chloroflexota bacterium]